MGYFVGTTLFFFFLFFFAWETEFMGNAECTKSL